MNLIFQVTDYLDTEFLTTNLKCAIEKFVELGDPDIFVWVDGGDFLFRFKSGGEKDIEKLLERLELEIKQNRYSEPIGANQI